MITPEDERIANRQVTKLMALAHKEKWDIGFLANLSVPLFLQALLIEGIHMRPEVKHTLVKYTNSALNRVMQEVARELKESDE